jgi:putative tryptophan/tyrosine transport system substrate-binding protein
MRRREFIAGLGSAVAWPLAAQAQQPDRMRRIGVLMRLDEKDPTVKSIVSVFAQALADLGWTEGRNVWMDFRWGGGDTDRVRALAQELVGLQPDIILAGTTQARVALQRKTQTIPIVFASVIDPVLTGLATRLDRTNITGIGTLEAPSGRKWLELLSEIAPRLKRVAFMYNPELPSIVAYEGHFRQAARSLKIVPIDTPVRSDVEIEATIIALWREPESGLVVFPDAFTFAHRGG